MDTGAAFPEVVTREIGTALEGYGGVGGSVPISLAANLGIIGIVGKEGSTDCGIRWT